MLGCVDVGEFIQPACEVWSFGYFLSSAGLGAGGGGGSWEFLGMNPTLCSKCLVWSPAEGQPSLSPHAAAWVLLLSGPGIHWVSSLRHSTLGSTGFMGPALPKKEEETFIAR